MHVLFITCSVVFLLLYFLLVALWKLILTLTNLCSIKKQTVCRFLCLLGSLEDPCPEVTDCSVSSGKMQPSAANAECPHF